MEKPRPDPHALGLRMQFRDGQEYELRLVVDYLREAGDHITSGYEAADWLERKDHRR